MIRNRSALAGPTQRRAAGAAFVPEERNGHAAVGAFTLAENIVLTHHSDGAAPGGLIDRAYSSDWVTRIREAFDVRSGSDNPVAGSLSGGNLQKFVVGREILRQPKVLVVSQPTWGVDAGAASTIRQALIELAASGAAVLVISQDLEEIFSICDRDRSDASRETIESVPCDRDDAGTGRPADGRCRRRGRPNCRGRRVIVLQPRPEPSRLLSILSPVIAILLMLIAGGIMLHLMGKPPLHSLYVYFFQPFHEFWFYLTQPEQRAIWIYTPSEVLVKAIPLALIGAGLTICFTANVWNIGAAGQYTAGRNLWRCSGAVRA